MISETEELDPFNVALGGVLKNLRLRCVLSRDEITPIITRANLQRIEAGKAQVSLGTLRKLCAVYEVTPSHVIAVAESHFKGGRLQENLANTIDELKVSVASGRFDPMREDEVEQGLKTVRKNHLRESIKELAGTGCTNSQIAKCLGISVRTVLRHLASEDRHLD